MSPALITAALGLVITILSLSQVAPSITRAINSTVVASGLSREESLVQHIIQYKALEGVYPATMDDLIAKGYSRTSDNSNGFGGSYSFAIDSAKGLIAVSTTISNDSNRSQYLNSFRHTFKPIEMGAGVVKKTFIMPSTGAMGAAIPSANGSIRVSATAPSATAGGYWYDTSGGAAMLKVSNGSAWSATSTITTGGGAFAAPNAANIAASANDLPLAATTGDVRYVLNAANATLDTLIYYNGAWTQAIVAGTPVASANPSLTLLSAQTLPIGNVASVFGFDFKTALSALYVSTLAALTVDTSKVAWALKGVLPAGLSLNTATGVVAGTPTIKTAPAGSSFSVIATYNGVSGQQNYLVKVGPEFLWVKSISAGGRHTCAVTTAGAAKCWGNNGYGQLGNSSTSESYTQVAVNGLTSGVVSIEAGGYHTCALTDAGAVWCWGYNAFGQLGDGTLADKSTPVAVPGLGSGVTSMSAVEMQTCAVTTGGAAKCWGKNDSGQLGDGSTTQRSTPVAVSGLDGVSSTVASIALGADHTCAVTTSGAAKCWGNNGSGQLGDGTVTQRTSPVAVYGLQTGVSSIDLGWSHTCVVTTSSGAAKCWGNNGSGQLGDGTVTQRLVPVAVSGLTAYVGSISAGGLHTCAVTRTGGVQCWGHNGFAQLGNASTTPSSLVPAAVTGLSSGIKSVSAGGTHTCAVTTDNRVKCWGDNENGRLGDGTVVQKNAPIDVLVEAW